MDTFLQVLGIACLAMLGLIGLVMLWFVWKCWGAWREFRVLTKSMGTLWAGDVPPFRVKLERVDRPTWADRDQIEFLAGPLRKAGFVDLGIFDVTPSQIRLLALASEKSSIYAAILQHPQSGVHLELVTAYADGTDCTYHTSEVACLLDQWPFKKIKALPDLGAGELLERLLAERPQKAMLPATVEAFSDLYESLWAREFDWRIARGGLTAEEIRRLASANGGGVSEEDVRVVQRHWRLSINAHYHVELQRRFLASGRYSAVEWERMRDRVRFVHDNLEWDEVVAMCGLGTDDCYPILEYSEKISAEVDRLAAAFPPREAFARINELLKPEQRFEKLYELEQPVPAAVYLSPEYRVPSVYDDEN